MSKVYNHMGKGLRLKSSMPLIQGEMKEQVLLSDTSFSNGKTLYLDWGGIYRIFTNEQYSKDDKDYDIFMKIRKSKLYWIAMRPPIIPFDDTTRWDYDHINVQQMTVVNKEAKCHCLTEVRGI